MRRGPFGSMARLVLALGVVAAPRPVAAQTDSLRRQIQESQLRLEEIRAEREKLREEMEGVRTRVQDVSRELSNVEHQLSASRSALAEVDFQVDAVSDRIAVTTRELIRTRERLRESNAILQRRLRDVYKMGDLHTVRVLLGASSIPDLLTRYRYLRLIADYDRSLVDRVGALERELQGQSDELQGDLSELGRLRQAKLGEVAELRSVEQRHQQALEQFRGQERRALSRLDQLEADEARMADLVGDLERRRREADRRRVVAGEGSTPASMTTEDAGRLDWPVEGGLIYRFGRERRPNGTVLRWNGVGIAARPGTPVRAVRAGTVAMAGPFEGYGPTVVLSHGDGFYTLYLYLEDIGVVQGRHVEKGQVVGTVGGRETPEGPHIEFQIRAPVAGGSPQARDPLLWLKPRSDGS